MIGIMGNIVERIDGEKIGTVVDLLDTLKGCCRFSADGEFFLPLDLTDIDQVDNSRPE